PARSARCSAGCVDNQICTKLFCNLAIALRAARANEHTCDLILRVARNQTKHVSVVENLDSRILAESTTHMQIEQRPRERQHFELGWKSDAPTGACEPRNF